MRCYFQILNISYKDCVINDKVFTKIQHAIRPPEDHKEMQTEVVWTCLPFIRSSQHYLARHSERRKKTRQGKRWDDNIREWTGLEFAKSERAVENREKWRKLVVKSSVVPQRLSRLRNR